MNIEHFLTIKETGWMVANSNESDIVMSTRIRLARNLQNFRFPMLFTEDEADQIENKVLQTLMSTDGYKKHFSYFKIQEIPALQRQVLIEKHLISPYLAKMEKTGAAFLAQDESLSVMVNEEDHIRIQSLQPGLHIAEAYAEARALGDYLGKHLVYAYDEQFGYLTSCPTNVGTGLRASVMLHLPALTMLKKMNNLIHTLTRLGMTVRGIYGEGSENLGNVYQISNQVTLGKSEIDILDELHDLVERIIQKERLARKQLMERAPLLLEDKLYRSLGTLKYARILSSEEAATCLSNVRLGVDIGLIKDISRSRLNECMLLIQPGFIQQYSGMALQSNERDVYRAKILQQQLLLKADLKNRMDKGEEPYDV